MTFLVAATLALGACGGDDEGNGGTTGATAPAPTSTTETGTTGTTERERTGTTRDRTTTSKRGDGKGGDGSGSGGGSQGGSGKSGSGSQPAGQPGNVEKVAKTVCNSFLPKQIAQELKRGKKDPEDVARDYSRGFPERQREKAYEGCLAGLKAR